MKTYNCLVSLGSNIGTIDPRHQVPKYNCPRAEIVLLRALHGVDAVSNVKPTGNDAMIEDEDGNKSVATDMEVYRKLAVDYAHEQPHKVKMIEGLFGIRLTDLTGDLDDLEADLDGPSVVKRVEKPGADPLDDGADVTLPPPGAKGKRATAMME